MTQIIVSIIMLGITGIILYVILTELGNFLLTRVPFVPTKTEDIEDMVRRVGITEADYFYDIGSGNGRVVFLVEQLTKAKSKGLQRGGWTQFYAKLRAFLTGSKAEFVSGNFFNQPWNEASIIYGYLYPPLMTQVGEKALQDCQPGTRLVIRDFPITKMKPNEVWETPSNHTMYLYVI